MDPGFRRDDGVVLSRDDGVVVVVTTSEELDSGLRRNDEVRASAGMTPRADDTLNPHPSPPSAPNYKSY